jgi:hypothetical protein
MALDVSPSVVPHPILDCPTLNEVSSVATASDDAVTYVTHARPEVSDMSRMPGPKSLLEWVTVRMTNVTDG